MFKDFRQFVPSLVCLACDGCCRFSDDESPWRPKIAQEEIDAVKKEELPNKDLSHDFVDGNNSIKTATCDGQTICRFLLAEANTCDIYVFRPFECQLYPFVLTRKDNGISVAVHLACPFIQKNHGKEYYLQYVGYIKEFLNRQDVLNFIQQSSSLISDYKNEQKELEHLFVLKAP